ncbi:MAG: MFS transporter [Pseudomonadota bacterium]
MNKGQSIAISDWVKIGVIGVMCMAQTFPYYLVNSTVPTIFRAEGLELKDFWAFSFLTIPAWAKFVWAPIVDRYGWRRFGLRKSWILACTSLGAFSLIWLSFTPPSTETLFAVVAVLFVHMVIMQTQDIAVDAYTLENLKAHERGAGASVKVVFEGIGEALALAGLMYIFTRWTFGGAETGWVPMIFVASLLLMVFTTPVLIRQEPPLANEIAKRRAAGDNPRIMKFVRRIDTPFITGILFVGGFINFMLPALWGAMLVDFEFSLLEIGIILGVITPIGAPLGAIITGTLVTTFGLRKIVSAMAVLGAVCFVIVLTGAGAGFNPAPWFAPIGGALMQLNPDWAGAPRVVFAMITLLPAVFMLASLHMIMTVSRMGWASRTQAGTDFTLHGAVYNIGRTVTVALSPFIASAFGWTAFLFIMGALIIGLLLVYRIGMPQLDELCNRRRVQEGELTEMLI